MEKTNLSQEKAGGDKLTRRPMPGWKKQIYLKHELKHERNDLAIPKIKESMKKREIVPYPRIPGYQDRQVKIDSSSFSSHKKKTNLSFHGQLR